MNNDFGKPLVFDLNEEQRIRLKNGFHKMLDLYTKGVDDETNIIFEDILRGLSQKAYESLVRGIRFSEDKHYLQPDARVETYRGVLEAIKSLGVN